MAKKRGGGVFDGVNTPMHIMGKVGGWRILRNGGDDFEMGKRGRGLLTITLLEGLVDSPA